MTHIARSLVAKRVYPVLITIPILKKWAGYDFDNKSMLESGENSALNALFWSPLGPYGPPKNFWFWEIRIAA